MLPDPDVTKKLAAMQERNTRRGSIVLSVLLLVIVWVFTLPPEFRRADICEETDLRTGCTTASRLVQQVATHYQQCGRGEDSAPCVRLDLSIDPKSKEAFDATVQVLTRSGS